MKPAFLPEPAAYALLQRAGWPVPRHGWLGAAPPFVAGEPIVLKGLGEGLWHKSELGAVHFAPFDPAALAAEAAGMRARLAAAGHPWLGALVCERITLARTEGLPGEGFVSLSRHEAGWLALVGCGGLQAEALAAEVPPLRWPLDLMSPAEALAELEQHLLGRVWLGALRGTRALTTRPRLAALVASLWPLARLAEEAGLSLLELNPVAPDAAGELRPLDAVGHRADPPPPRFPPARDFLTALTQPRRVAIAGVSSHDGGAGRTIFDKLHQCPALAGRLLVIKPGPAEFLGVPCLPDVGALSADPVDLLLLALPAPAAAAVMAELLAQGGGARVVALVAGGLGDGADTAGLGESIAAPLHAARAAGRWTPAVLGPNFLGHWVPERALDTTFITADRITGPAAGGALTVLAQSGAFMLCRWSRNPQLRLRLGVALGNQLDVALPDYLEVLATDAGCRAVAAYVEGFTEAQLAATVRAARALRARGAPLVLLRAGRTAAGRAAAASHTGTMAGDLAVERAFLGRAGAKFAPSMAAFDATLAWLSVYPEIKSGPLAFITNAGLEAVNASDLATPAQPIATLSTELQHELELLLAAERLTGLVAARLPLDLTPMARPEVFLRAAELLLRSEAAVLLVGLVPFTLNVLTEPAAATGFARALAGLAQTAGKPVALVVDAGPAFQDLRVALATSGLPVFARVEEAIAGLQVLA